MISYHEWSELVKNYLYITLNKLLKTRKSKLLKKMISLIKSVEFLAVDTIFLTNSGSSPTSKPTLAT